MSVIVFDSIAHIEGFLFKVARRVAGRRKKRQPRLAAVFLLSDKFVEMLDVIKHFIDVKRFTNQHIDAVFLIVFFKFDRVVGRDHDHFNVWAMLF